MTTDLGSCCKCGRKGRRVRNLIALDRLAPEPGKGWGCVQCGLSGDGAIAVLCDRCLDETQGRPERIPWAVAGYPGEDRRVPMVALTGTHKHRMELHPEAAR